MKIDSEAIKVITTWWRKALEKPNFDNGDNSFNGFLFKLLAQDWHKAPSDEQLNAFEAMLAEAVMRKAQDNPYQILLSVDYHPCQILFDAAKQAGIQDPDSLLLWPCKTCMWIEEGKIRVAMGYRAPAQVIWEITESGESA